MLKLISTNQTLFIPNTTPKSVCDSLNRAVLHELEQDFTCVVSDNHFEIIPLQSLFMPNWKTFSSTVYGTLIETDLGTIVELTFDMSPVGKFLLGTLLCVVVCGEVGLFVASSKVDFTPFHFLFPLFASLIFVLAALSGVKGSKDTLMELLSKIVLNSEDIY